MDGRSVQVHHLLDGGSESTHRFRRISDIAKDAHNKQASITKTPRGFIVWQRSSLKRAIIYFARSFRRPPQHSYKSHEALQAARQIWVNRRNQRYLLPIFREPVPKRVTQR